MVTALRKTGAEVKVYTKHQDLTQASKNHKQIRMRYSPLRRVSMVYMCVYVFITGEGESQWFIYNVVYFFIVGGLLELMIEDGLYSVTALREND